MYIFSIIIIILSGTWGVGLATANVRVDTVPLGKDQQSWVLTSDGTTLHNGEVIAQLSKKPMEGDTVVSIVVDVLLLLRCRFYM